MKKINKFFNSILYFSFSPTLEYYGLFLDWVILY